MQKAKNQKRGPGKAADRKAALSAQQTIPYLVMHPDGVCQLPGGLYTKTVEYEDINYSVASTEDQTAIFVSEHHGEAVHFPGKEACLVSQPFF